MRVRRLRAGWIPVALTGGEQVLAGPIVRSVATDRVSIFVALRAPVEKVRLLIYLDHGADAAPVFDAAFDPVRIGERLWVALPTARGLTLVPNTIYAYDLEFIDGGSHPRFKDLGLLADGMIGGHRHLALGYDQGRLPAFKTPPDRAADLAFAHGSCRRPYAQGLDALVALDQMIAGAREAPTRPHYLFLTGDQIYADDLSEEMLGWANRLGNDLIGMNGAVPREQLRVDLTDKVARFGADTYHFPPGRRARIAARKAKLTSDDNRNHAFSFGELAAHYLMSWSNIGWPKLELDSDPESTKSLYAARGAYVREYLTSWRRLYGVARGMIKIGDDKISDDEHIEDRVQRGPAWLLMPKDYRAIDSFAPDPPVDEWFASATWKQLWASTAPPDPPSDKAIGATCGWPDPLHDSRFPDNPDDLGALQRLLTPTWYAGWEHFQISNDYKLAKDDVPEHIEDLELTEDAVLLRLDRLRCFYEGLPNARRALANVSTLMMFDDHEVTDDFAVTKRWRDDLRATSLGRDVMSNALAAYLVFQDWGNVPDRYDDGSHNAQAFAAIQRMFLDANGEPRATGPEEEARTQLETLFGFARSEVPFEQQVTWSYSITDPGIAPYEILMLDNRTRRGYDTSDSDPSNLSLEAIAEQVPASGPAGSVVTIVIAPLPIVGYPPMEELAQPLSIIVDEKEKPHSGSQSKIWKEIERDYAFGKLIRDPEAWPFSPKAQEAILARLASRPAVVLLSGDIHFSLTGKLTYWTRVDNVPHPGLQAKSRIVQLISSALKNEPGGLKQALVQLGIAEQLGAVIGGPFDRLGWPGGTEAPDFDKSFITIHSPLQLGFRARQNPAIIPTRMLDDDVKKKLYAGELAPAWAWRFEVVKDDRHDDERYKPFAAMQPEWQLPDESQLDEDHREAAIVKIAAHHKWHAFFGMPRRSFFYSNIGIVRFAPTSQPDEPVGSLDVYHALWSFDRSVTNPRGTIDFTRPWPLTRNAYPFTEYRVPLSFANERAPDQDPDGRP